MIVILNGPIGCGKSTLSEALAESLEDCVMLDGDHLVAVNPPPRDEIGLLHSTIALLVMHYRRFGYRRFVINHLWRTAEELADLRRWLLDIDAEEDIRCFLLMLPRAENIRRIETRQTMRGHDEREFEHRTMTEERDLLFTGSRGDLGELFDVSAPPAELVESMAHRLGLR